MNIFRSPSSSSGTTTPNWSAYGFDSLSWSPVYDHTPGNQPGMNEPLNKPLREPLRPPTRPVFDRPIEDEPESPEDDQEDSL